MFRRIGGFYPSKWMVKIMEIQPYEQMDDLGGKNSYIWKPNDMFHIIGDGHQANSRGLYTHYKDFLKERSLDRGTTWIFDRNKTFFEGEPRIEDLRALERIGMLCLQGRGRTTVPRR